MRRLLRPAARALGDAARRRDHRRRHLERDALAVLPHAANLLDLVTPYVFIGLLAFGLTFVVIAGEIDISVASTLAVSVVSFAQIFEHGVNIWLAALVGARGRGRARPRQRARSSACSTCPRSRSRSARSPRTRGSRSWSSRAKAWPSSRRLTQLRRRLHPTTSSRCALVVLVVAAVVLGVRAPRHAVRPLPVRDRLEPRGGAALGHPGDARARDASS